MGMKQIQQITDLLSTPKGEFIVNCWEQLIFSITYGKTYKAVNIRRLELDIDINFNSDSLLANLNNYFEKIDSKADVFRNKVCKKGCCDCCTNDFEISASEHFMLLRYTDIKFGKPSFTNDDSLRKILYLESKNIVSHWSVSCRKWDMVPSNFQ